MDRKRQLVNEQIQLERDDLQAGVERYRRLLEQRPAVFSRVGQDFLQQHLESLVAAIRSEQAVLSDSRIRPKPPKYALPFLSLDPDKLALLTLRAVLQSIILAADRGRLATFTATAAQVGEACRRERFADLEAGRAKPIEDILRRRNNSRNAAARAMEKAARVDTRSYWSEQDRVLHLGAALLTLAEEHSRTFQRVRTSSRRGKTPITRVLIAPTEDALDWISARREAYESLAAPIYWPMVVEPRTWGRLTGGGYLTYRHSLVKRLRHSHRRALKDANLATVFLALNAMQETSWTINRSVYQVLRELDERGELVSVASGRSLFSRPSRIPTFQENANVVNRAHRDAEALARLCLLRARLGACARLASYERFYFPHQLDFRGRAYAIPNHLNPQADDLSRALLQFADGYPAGPSGVRWLAIHLANNWGHDKLPFPDRISWVEQHSDLIMDSASAPVTGERQWLKADKPWSFLAACFEWSRISTNEEAPSYLPVSVDGTCNGIQHLSALARDVDGARLTNLLPTDTRQDIYQAVAERLKELLAIEADQGNNKARAWLNWLTNSGREAVKDATMTTPYGVTRQGIANQLRRRLEKSVSDGDEGAPLLLAQAKEARSFIDYLAAKLEMAINETVAPAKAIMRWLQGIAQTLGRKGRGLSWVTPSGFRVIQEERRPAARRIRTRGLSMVVLDREKGVKLDVRRQVRSVAANYVHSLDAAHMMLTAARLGNEGIVDMVFVHDSFGTHARHVDTLGRGLREEFVQLHERPLLELFVQEQRKANPDVPLPDPPQGGALQLSQVLVSDYFFC